MKKTLIIIGILAVTGGVAYFILKRGKGKEQLNTVPNVLGNTVIAPAVSTSTSPQLTTSGQVVSGIDSPQAVIAQTEQANLEKANEIAVNLRKVYEALGKLNTANRIGVISKSNYNTQSVIITTKISSLKSDLNKLGYIFEGTTKGTIKRV